MNAGVEASLAERSPWLVECHRGRAVGCPRGSRERGSEPSEGFLEQIDFSGLPGRAPEAGA